MKLHVGCGPRIIDGWENVDIDPGEGAVRGDVTNLQYADNTVTRIYCEDLFEHLDQKEQFKFLSECYRVLEPDGLLRISCPDLFGALTRQKEDEALWNSPWNWGHLLIPTSGYLKEIANWVGFGVFFGERNDGAAYGFPEDLRPFLPDGCPSSHYRDLAELDHIFATFSPRP